MATFQSGFLTTLVAPQQWSDFFFSVRYIPCTFQISLNNMSIDRHDDLGYPATFQDRLSLMMLRDVPANFQHNNQIFNTEMALPSGFTWRTVLLKQHIFLSVITPKLFTCQEQTAPRQTREHGLGWCFDCLEVNLVIRLRWLTLRGLINSFDMKSKADQKSLWTKTNVSHPWCGARPTPDALWVTGDILCHKFLSFSRCGNDFDICFLFLKGWQVKHSFVTRLRLKLIWC